MSDRALKFDNSQLQEKLISGLQGSGIAFVVEGDTTVTCSESDYAAVVDVAHVVRDSCFRWYFRSADDNNWSTAFRNVLEASGQPFQLEYHNRRMVFLLPKGNESLHDELSDRAYEAAYPARG
jgi:membrane-bound lytic murein transglycosylase MltF